MQHPAFLPPATKLGQGYIFTEVCDSVHRGGGVHGRGGCAWRGVHDGGVHGRGCVRGRGHAWQGGMRDSHAPPR